MDKEITFAAVSRSLNRLEGFVDDFLLTVQSYNEKRNIEKQNVIVDGHKETMVIYPIDIKESIIRHVKEVERNMNGDESIDYIGIHDCVDFILNNQSMLLAKRAFSIESKVREIESILLSHCSGSMIKPVSDLTWQTGHILWEIGELHIEPFIKESTQDAVIPETGENSSESNDGEQKADVKAAPKDCPEWKDAEESIKALFQYPRNYNEFLNGCYLPNGKVKEIPDIVTLYNTKRVQNSKTIAKGVPTTLYDFLVCCNVIIVKPDNPDEKLRTFQRYMKKLR